jgi:hypothetical protein
MGKRKRFIVGATGLALGVLLASGFIPLMHYFGWLILSPQYIFFKVLLFAVVGGLAVVIFRWLKINE